MSFMPFIQEKTIWGVGGPVPHREWSTHPSRIWGKSEFYKALEVVMQKEVVAG